MSEVQQTEGTISNQSGNPAPQQPAPQRTEPSIPEGKRIVDVSEYETLARQANNYKGASGLIDRMVKSNIRTPEDLDRVLDTYQKVNGIGLDVNQLASAFRRDEPVQESGQVESQYDPEEIESKITQTVNARLAAVEHQSAAKRESELVSSYAKKLAGEGASQGKIDAARRLIEYEIRNDSAQFYDPNDQSFGSLADKFFKPHDEKTLAGVLEKVGAQWKELSASEIREAARRGTPTPGQSATGGDGPATDGKQNRPFASLSQEEKLREITRRFNGAAGGMPMSQA